MTSDARTTDPDASVITAEQEQRIRDMVACKPPMATWMADVAALLAEVDRLRAILDDPIAVWDRSHYLARRDEDIEEDIVAVFLALRDEDSDYDD